MSANHRIGALILTILLVGCEENDSRRPVVTGLKPPSAQELEDMPHNPGVLFFGSGQWLAYIRVKGARESVVTRFADGTFEESESWDSVSKLAISPDGKTLTYVGVRDGKSHFVANDKWSPAFADIGEPAGGVFSTDGAHWAQIIAPDWSRRFVVHDGVRDDFDVDSFVKPFFSPSGKLVYPAYRMESLDPPKMAQFVVVDGKAGKVYGRLDSSLQIKADTEEVVYAAQSSTEDRWFVVTGDREGKPYTTVSRPRISADGKTIAYVAKLDRKSVVVINDREFGPHECCTLESTLVMDPDGRRVAYPAGERAQSGNQTVFRMVVDGIPSAQTYDGIRDVVLTEPTASRPRLAFTAVRKAAGQERHAVMVDDVSGTEYEWTQLLRFSAGGDLFYIAKEGAREFPVREREAGPAFDEIREFTMSDDRKQVAVFGVRKGKSYLARWTGSAWKESAPYERIMLPILFDASGAPVYRAARKGQQFVVIGDQEQASYDEVHDVRVGLDGRGVLAVASRGEKVLLILDGREIATEEGIGDLGTPEKYRNTEGRKEIKVTAGRIDTFRSRDETFYLQLNDKTIYTFDNPTGGGPSITFQGTLKREDLFLMAEYHGDGCPEMSSLIAIDAAGETFVSEPIGNCHSEASLKTFEDRLEIRFGYDDPDYVPKRWMYRPGGSLLQEPLRAQDLLSSGPIAQSWGRQADFFREKNFEVLSWDDAEPILSKEQLAGGKQYHNGWLTIFLQDGRSFLTKPPDINYVVELAKRHEGFGVE